MSLLKLWLDIVLLVLFRAAVKVIWLVVKLIVYGVLNFERLGEYVWVIPFE